MSSCNSSPLKYPCSFLPQIPELNIAFLQENIGMISIIVLSILLMIALYAYKTDKISGLNDYFDSLKKNISSLWSKKSVSFSD